MRRSRSLGVVAALLGVLALSGCGSDDEEPGLGDDLTPTVAVDDAPQTYGGLADEVATSVAAALDTTSSKRSPGGYVEDHGICQFWSDVYELPTSFGEDVSWDDVRGAIEDAVPDGWTLGDELAIPGGYTGFDVTEDDTGATVEVRAKGTSTLRVGAPVEGDCPDS